MFSKTYTFAPFITVYSSLKLKLDYEWHRADADSLAFVGEYGFPFKLVQLFWKCLAAHVPQETIRILGRPSLPA